MIAPIKLDLVDLFLVKIDHMKGRESTNNATLSCLDVASWLVCVNKNVNYLKWRTLNTLIFFFFQLVYLFEVYT